MPPHDLKRRATAGFAWLFSGTLGQYLVQFAAIAILARLLAPADFGVVASSMAIIGVAAVFSELGVGPALVQKESLSEVDIGTATVLSLVAGLVLVGLALLGADSVAGWLRMPELRAVLAWLSPALLFSSAGVVATCLLQRTLRFRAIATVNLASYAVGYLGVAVPMALLGHGVWSLVSAHLVQTALTALLSWWQLPGTFRLRGSVASARGLLRFGAGYSLGRLANTVAMQGDNLLAGRLLGAAALGFYSRAYQLMVMPAMLIGGVIDRVLFPTMAGMRHDRALVARTFARTVAVAALLALPLSAMMVVLAEEIILLVFGTQWMEAVPPFRWLAACVYFRLAYKLSDSLAHAEGAVYSKLWRQVVYAAAVVLAAWIGHRHGVEGIAAGVALAVVLNYALMLQLSRRLLGEAWIGLRGVHVRHTLVAVGIGGLAYATRAGLLLVVPAPLPVLAGTAAVCGAALMALLAAGDRVLGAEGRMLRDALRALATRRRERSP